MSGATASEQAVSDSYLDAIRRALHDELASDPSVFLYGQDIEDPFGGAFKATKGLSTAFPGRVRNAPICEDAMTGLCIGAALGGLRPVLEFQFGDFATVAFNQLVNHAGSTFWRTGKSCPLTVRMPVGGTPGSGPFHSQSPEAWLCGHPGLTVFAPSTVADAYHLLRAAIRLPDPVIFLEHKLLYFRQSAEIPEVSDLPAGRARIVRPGRDCTVVSWGALVHDALAAADDLAQAGVEVEVIDLRCVKPLDLDTISGSLARTGRLLVATESWPYGSTSAEILAQISERCFSLLDAPPRRLCSRPTPIPYQTDLWQAHRVQAADIAQAVRALTHF